MLNPVIAQAVDFTETYKKYKDAPIPIREAMCFKTQYPALLPAIRDGDVFAGRRTEKRIIYVGSVWWFGLPGYTPERNAEGKQGGYCFDFSSLYTLPQNDEERKILEDLYAFWNTECNAAKLYAQSEIRDGVGFLVSSDLDKLIQKGLPGLVSEVTAMAESDFRTGLLLVLEAVMDVCRFYRKQAEEKGRKDIADTVGAIIEHAPDTLAQALQLLLIFELLSHEKHYENNRFDVALGDLYINEIDSGALTQEQAIELIHAFYKMVNENGEVTVCRLMMGGKGRRNVENADRLIEAALLAEQRHKQVTPQVSVRIYDGFNPKILELAYDTINETYTFPTLYNDDTIIGGVAHAFGVSLEEAENYYPLGCGELTLGHKSPSILVSGWNVPQTVDEGIRAYNSSVSGMDGSAHQGTFNDLYNSVLARIRHQAAVFARYHKQLVDVNKAQNAFLMVSLLTDDCLRRGKPILDGGAAFMSVCVMGHGYTNAADSLTAIKKVVYTDGAYSLAEVVQALDADFAGYENIRKALIAAPKYGNDSDDADLMVRRLWRDITDEAGKAGKEYGFDAMIVSSVNPGGHYMGAGTGATADGRRRGESFAIGNSPAAGADTSGLTALMNSILKTDPVNGGSVTNFKVSREFFTNEREKFISLFLVYWQSGGLQANVTIVNKGDLEAAIKEPEKFPHLLVRLGGWTARFIDLSPFIQQEILKRTLY
ncbi:MAG: hypothetical protein FWF29_07330 [Treponema sp.]|nr:hypothetical protein [Treponema sp.]